MANELNNKYVKPPFGDAQILRYNSLELTLNHCNFNPSGNLGPIGYQRWQSSPTVAKVNQYTVFGSSPIRSPLFTEKFAFEWDLILDQDQWYIMEAIIRAQQFNIQSRQDADVIPVELGDARKVLIEPSPRDRARISDVPQSVIDNTPAGFDPFYPKFDVLLSVAQDQIDWLMDETTDRTLVNFRMIALELDKIPTSEDEDLEIDPVV